MQPSQSMAKGAAGGPFLRQHKARWAAVKALYVKVTQADCCDLQSTCAVHIPQVRLAAARDPQVPPTAAAVCLEWSHADAPVPLSVSGVATLQMVLAAALHTASEDAVAAMAAGQGQQQQEPVVHIADKFRQAYIDRAKRLYEKERRLAAAEQKKQLKASHALRTMHAWLDEQN